MRLCYLVLKKNEKKKKCNKSQSCYQPVRLYLFINQPLSIELIHRFRRTPFFNILILYYNRTKHDIEFSFVSKFRQPIRNGFRCACNSRYSQFSSFFSFFFFFFLFSFFYAILASDFKIACERSTSTPRATSVD